jgi:uncharacterized membrane protein
MITLTVWKFSASDGAENALPRLAGLAARDLVIVEEVAAVAWPEGLRKPTTRTLGSLTGPGTLWGGSWGVLLSLIFLTPLAGPAFGAAAGAVAGTLSDFGIDDDFIIRVRQLVTPGTSALFVVCDGATAERLAFEWSDLDVELVRCDLSSEQERRLRYALGEESEQTRR